MTAGGQSGMAITTMRTMEMATLVAVQVGTHADVQIMTPTSEQFQHDNCQLSQMTEPCKCNVSFRVEIVFPVRSTPRKVCGRCTLTLEVNTSVGHNCHLCKHIYIYIYVHDSSLLVKEKAVNLCC
jgi:hypothetical protein